MRKNMALLIVLLLAIMVIAVTALSLNISALHKGKSGLHHECQEFGFNLSIAQWKTKNKSWVPIGDAMGTIVTGNRTEASWDVGVFDDFGDTGIVAKSGKIKSSQSGANGTVTSNKTLNNIIFCLKFTPCGPPPPPP